MVGPFMQGMLLMGVIYWHSKGMFNMINDYYRSEFQKQLQSNAAERKPTEVDEIEVLLKKPDDGIQDIKKSVLKSEILEHVFCPILDHEPDVCFNLTELNKFLEIALLVCFDKNSSDVLPNMKQKTSQGCSNDFVVDSVSKT